MTDPLRENSRKPAKNKRKVLKPSQIIIFVLGGKPDRFKGDSIENFILTTRASAHLLLYIVVIIVAGKKMQECEMKYTLN